MTLISIAKYPLEDNNGTHMKGVTSSHVIELRSTQWNGIHTWHGKLSQLLMTGDSWSLEENSLLPLC